VSQAIGTPPGT